MLKGWRGMTRGRLAEPEQYMPNMLSDGRYGLGTGGLLRQATRGKLCRLIGHDVYHAGACNGVQD